MSLWCRKIERKKGRKIFRLSRRTGQPGRNRSSQQKASDFPPWRSHRFRAAGDPDAAQLVAGECVVLAETKDHANWELIGRKPKRRPPPEEVKNVETASDAASAGKARGEMLGWASMGGWCCWRGLNSRPLPYQGSALPLSYNSVRGRGAAPAREPA